MNFKKSKKTKTNKKNKGSKIANLYKQNMSGRVTLLPGTILAGHSFVKNKTH